jgi:hypothetical protein
LWFGIDKREGSIVSQDLILAHRPTTAEWLWREVLTLQSAFEHPIELDRLLHNRHVLKRAPRSWRTKLEGLSR